MSVSANMLRMLNDGQKKSNQEVIIDYLVSEQGVVTLSPLQEELLKRWQSAYDLMQVKRYKQNEIANMLCNQYKYGVTTALRDIDDARYVFGGQRKSNKRFLSIVNVEYLEEYAQALRKIGKHELAIRILAIRTEAIKNLPEDANKNTAAAPIIFNITNNNALVLMSENMTDEKAADILNAIQ